MFFRRKKNKEPEKAPTWFMWLMGGFVAYALITNIFTDKVPNMQEEAAPKVQSDMDYFNFSVVGSQGMSGPPRPLFLRDVTVGKGTLAECWHKVKVHYKLYDSKGELIEDTRTTKPVEFNLGRGEVPLALERGTLGIRAGGVRAVTARPEMLFGDKKFSHPAMQSSQFGGYIVELEETSRPENLPFSDLGLRVYEDIVGEGKLAQCTDKLRVRINAWNTLGQPIWRNINLPAIFVWLGEGKAPYAIERGLMNMKVGGKRTLIVPPGYMNPLFAKTTEAQVQEILQAEELAAEIEAQPAQGIEKTRQAYEKALEAQNPEFPWEDLPVPADQVIILELQLLHENIQLPNQPKQPESN